MNRRELLKGLVAAPIAATVLPELVADDGVALFSTSHLDIAPLGTLQTGKVAKLLQEGVHKLMTEQYSRHPLGGGSSAERFLYPRHALFSDVLARTV